ncbi:MFS transporter [Bacillus sonorensis]|nr:MFS transporter [Bacillus sonorensis]
MEASYLWLSSALCGTAASIEQLSIYRAIQGIGGGALIPIAFTIIFDIFPPEKRGKVSGLFGAVFGLSSIFGPLIGAYITDYISWHWVFYINLPLGLISFLLILLFYKEAKQHEKQKSTGLARLHSWAQSFASCSRLSLAVKNMLGIQASFFCFLAVQLFYLFVSF